MSITTDYRPQTWEEVVGQEHIISSLKKSVTDKKLANAYLFHGIRGTGKTTTARILAKALNCKKAKDGVPCNVCTTCKNITLGNSLDVKELDMATNRGIDDVRAIQEGVSYAPTGGKYRVMIMDEAHQMTPQAASALLKILEEPPKNVIFVLCTTELTKILPTIRSRCQVHAFRKVSGEELINRLAGILSQEGLITEETYTEETQEVLQAIITLADGSVRDAESKLSNLISYGSITKESFDQTFSNSSNQYEVFYKYISKGDVVGVVREFMLAEETLVSPLDWVTGLASFVFDKMLKDDKNWQYYSAQLDIIEDYVRHATNNQPVLYIKLMLVKLANVNVKNFVATLESTESDIWDLARWFDAKQVEKFKDYYSFMIENLVMIFIVEQLDNTNKNTPKILMSSISEIINLPKDIDKNELVEKGLIIVE